MSRKKFEPFLDALIFGINYDLGHLYFDRCGQCLNDIEETCKGWYFTGANVNSGQMENPENEFFIEFNNSRYSFTARKAFKRDIGLIASEANAVWKIIKANLGLTSFSRIGCRPQYLLATPSIEEAEKRIQKAEIKISLPEGLKKSGYAIRTQQVILNLIKESVDYRLNLSSIIRQEAINPDGILKGDARFFSQRQREYFLSQQKQLAEYSVNPMFAISLDIDCSQMNPENVNVIDYIHNQTEIVNKDFLQILEKI